MPNFSVESWDSFKQQFMSVIQFIYYCFDMLFDTCRSNPMLYAFFFFPVFAVAFFLIFEMLVHIAPFAAVINNKQVKGVLSSSKLSAKSYGKSMNSSRSVQAMAAKKAAQDAKAHNAMINKINGSGSPGTSLSAKAMSSGTSDSSLSASSEGKKITGKSGYDMNTKKHKDRRKKLKAFLKNGSGNGVVLDDESSGINNSSDSWKVSGIPHSEGNKKANLNIEAD